MAYEIPKLILQPIIENAIKHGLENMIEPCHISIEADDYEGCLVIKVSDDGPGMSEEMVSLINTNRDYVSKKGTGIGVININRRLKMVYGNGYGLYVESVLDQGTDIYIKMPI